MASSNRKIIKKLYAKLAKRYTDHPDCLDKGREVLEHLVYAAFLENASFGAANQCFSVLESYFVDWNEIRVSTARELAEVFASVYEPERTGERIRRILQYVFESLYKFDLEEFRARGPVEMLEYLQSIPYSTDFINSYTVNTVFKMQDIPLDEGSLRVLRLLDLVEINERNRECVEGLGNAFTQGERFEFFQCLHALGLELLDTTRRPAAIEFLKEIDPQVGQRSDIPLVDLTDVTDPFLIAKQLSRKEHKPKMPIALSLDEEGDSEIIDEVIEDDLLDPGEEPIEEEEEETYTEIRVESHIESLDDDFVCPSPEVERKKNRSAAKRDRAGSVKDSNATPHKKSDEKKAENASVQDLPQAESEPSAPVATSKTSGSKVRPSRNVASSNDETGQKKSDSKSSRSSDRKKAESTDKKGKEAGTASVASSGSSTKSSGKETTSARREKQPSEEKSKAKPVGKSAAGPVTRETTTRSSKNTAPAKKGTPAKAAAKPEKAAKTPARKDQAETTTGTDKAKKTPAKSNEAKKDTVKKGGAKGDGAKKDGPKQDADKVKKASATKKLQQKKPH